MGVDLKYSLDDFETTINKIQALSDSISNNKKSFYSGFEKLRNDWVSEGSIKFFESLDTSWLNGVEECIQILNDLVTALKDAKKEYEAIEPDAVAKLVF